MFSKGKIYRGSSWKGDDKRSSRRKITGDSLKYTNDSRLHKN